jgi:hypothetical protein
MGSQGTVLTVYRIRIPYTYTYTYTYTVPVQYMYCNSRSYVLVPKHPEARKHARASPRSALQYRSADYFDCRRAQKQSNSPQGHFDRIKNIFAVIVCSKTFFWNMATQARGLQNFISDLRNAKSKVRFGTYTASCGASSRWPWPSFIVEMTISGFEKRVLHQ